MKKKSENDNRSVVSPITSSQTLEEVLIQIFFESADFSVCLTTNSYLIQQLALCRTVYVDELTSHAYKWVVRSVKLFGSYGRLRMCSPPCFWDSYECSCNWIFTAAVSP
ncbi:hypothetical protein Bca4012_037842 [Brassica carinata]